MRKIKALVLAVTIAAATMGVASPANASTCAIADPEVEGVVCVAYGSLSPVYRVLCESKYKICFA